MVDITRLGVPDSVDRLQFNAARTLASDRAALTQHVLSWLTAHYSAPDHNSLAGDVCGAHMPSREQERLHINFTSVEALHRALVRCPFLVRCGSLSASAWQSNKPCGPQRHLCPELIQLSFTPVRAATSAEVEEKTKLLVAEMKLDYTALWLSSSRAPTGSNKNATSRIQVNILPRDASKVAAVVKQYLLQFGINDGKIRMQAPNSPDLCRCTQCDQLGHRSNKCVKYDGFAMRLPMKHPMSFHGMTQLVSILGARCGFIGSNMEEMKPSRRVTLLFDINATDLAQLADVVTRIASVITSQQLDLFDTPYHLENIQHRSTECVECGSTDRTHACHFRQSFLGSAAAHAPQPRVGAASASHAPPAAVLVARHGGALDSSSLNMCRAWFKSKTCPRKEKGQQCKYDHPPQHTRPDNTCFQFSQHGSCNRGEACRFIHAAALTPVVDSQPEQAPPSTHAPSRAPTSDAATEAATPPAADLSALAETLPPPPSASSSNAAAAVASAAAAAATPKKKRGRAAAAAPISNSDAHSASMSDNAEASDTRLDSSNASAPSGGRSKKQRASSISNTNQWSVLQDDDDDDNSPTPVTRAPSSSLSSLSSPSKNTVQRGNSKKKTLTQ